MQVLAALAEQIDQLAGAYRRGRLPIPLAMPVEVLVLFDSQDTAAADVETAVSSGLGETPNIDLQIVPAPGLEYFEMKNHGACESRGDLIVYLDSDVIPQPNWLASLLESFADPAVHAVASRAFVKPDSLYAKTVALTWLFSLPAEESGLVPAKKFHANGAAFRREVILSYPYPSRPQQVRGPGYELMLNLRAAGIEVYEQTEALVDHPPPLGAQAYLARGFAQGSDDYYAARRRFGGWKVFLPRSLVRAGRKWTRAMLNLVSQRKRVGLSLMELPIAAFIATAYYASYAAGDVTARFRRPMKEVANAEANGTEEVVSLRFPTQGAREELPPRVKPRRKAA